MNNESNRKDVQIKIARMIEMMKRPNGASSKEICTELECNSRTFYRNLDRLQEMGVPLFDKSDYDGATNSKRWYIKEQSISDSNIFLSPEEKLYLRIMVEQNKNISKKPELSDSILNKINKTILHDVNKNKFKLNDSEFSLSPSFEYNDNVPIFTEAVDSQTTLAFSSADFYFPSETSKGMVEVATTKCKKRDFQFEPYSILLKNDSIKNNLCCIGRIKGEDFNTSIQCVKINSVKNLKKTNRHFTTEINYSLPKWEEYFFPVFKQDVHLVIDFFALQSLEEKSWFLDKKCVKEIDKYHVFFTTTEIAKLEKLILSYGFHIQVIEPEELSVKILREHRKAHMLSDKIPEDSIQQDEYFYQADLGYSLENDDSAYDWKKNLYSVVENKKFKNKDSDFDANSIFTFNDANTNELLKIVHTDNNKTIFFYNGQIAFNYERVVNVEMVSFDEATQLLNNWEKSVDEIISKYASELVLQKEKYKKNGPLFFYFCANCPPSEIIDYLQMTGLVPHHISFREEDDYLNLPGRIIEFRSDLVNQTEIKLTVYKWWKK